jgi:diguanylate cyclase
VQAASFAPVGERHPLSISIGGVTFSPPVTFPELYRDADKRLYAAKHAGRNRVDIVGHSAWHQQRAAGAA